MDYNQLRAYNYILFNMYSKEYIDELYNQLNRRKLIYLLFKNLICSVVFLFLALKNIGNYRLKQQKIVFFAFSKNNYEALKPIYEILKPKSILLSRKIKHDGEVLFMPVFIPLLLSYLYLPKYIGFYIKATKDDKKILELKFDKVLYSLGYELFCKLYVSWLAPRAIVFANDHIFYTRVFTSIAERKGIKCFFLQHSSTFDNVPKIYSSFALLEGNHAKEKYLKAGSDEKKIQLIGMPKFDEYIYYINNNNTLNRIGICTNRSMNTEDTSEMIDFIRQKFPKFQLILRPHPGLESKDKYIDIIKRYKLEFSDSKKIHTFYFLKDVDAVISGNSSILLEAAIQNVFPIYYFTPKTEFYYNHDRFDKYDYVKNKVAASVENLGGLEELLRNLIKYKPFIRNNAKHYCDTIGTPHDGKSAILAAETIEDLII